MDTLVKPKTPVCNARAVDIQFTQDDLSVYLEDGRVITVPLEWFPAFRGASVNDLRQWSLIGGGIGIHWEKLNEDISVKGLLES